MKKLTRFDSKVFGGMFLVAGSCIGAGMLALPILTGLAGFFPSLLTLIIAWLFMTFTGLLLVEMNGWFHKQVNFISMTKESLGKIGKLIAWLSYAFLFYSLLIAYASASGAVFSSILSSLFSLSLSPPAASIFFTIFFGYVVYLGTRPVDLLNRILMVGLILTYLGMISLGLSKIEPDLLLYSAPRFTLLSLPVLVISFGFQNMIPSLTTYLEYDLKKVRLTVVGGSLIAFIVYMVWSLLVLGVVDPASIHESYTLGQEATIPLKKALGSSKVSSFAQGFAFFAIVTSFLAQGLTLTHFLADGFGKTPSKKNLFFFVSLALLPPLFFALYKPQIFFRALSFAGGICAMVLFGILPALMAWIGRYVQKHPAPYRVKGGKLSLILTLGFSLFVICLELFRSFSS